MLLALRHNSVANSCPLCNRNVKPNEEVGMPFDWTEENLRAQYTVARRHGWIGLITAAAQAAGQPVALLLGMASRETGFLWSRHPDGAILVRSIRRKSRVNTSICGPGSRVLCIARFAFPDRPSLSLWCLVSSPIALHWGGASAMQSTARKHLRQQ